MKHHAFIISLFITTPCIAMEITTTKQNSSKKYAQFLDNNHIITGGEHGCNVIDLTTNKETRKISDQKCDILTLHPNKEKVALCNDKTVTIYNTKTATAEWSITAPDIIKSVIFNPLDTTIFFVYCHEFRHYHIMKCNYLTNEQDDVNTQNNAHSPIIAFNPIKNEMCKVQSWHVMIYPLDLTFRLFPGFSVNKSSNFAQFSPDGSCIMIDQVYDGMLLVNSKNNNFKNSYIKEQCTHEYYESFRNILFYSNSILAIISTIKAQSAPWNCMHSIVHYWDIHEKQPIHTSDPLDIAKHYDLSFSPDKTKIMINGRILPVPFEAIYQSGTKQIFPYFLFLLKNYLDQYPHLKIPQEITPLIALHLLEIFKR